MLRPMLPLVLLAGCVSVPDPVPTPPGPDAAAPLSAYALRPEEAQPFDPWSLPATHRVRANETLYFIASRYQIPMRALIEENGLEPPYHLSVGQLLRLPPPRFHVVAYGEAFEDIARRYNVDPRSLALFNRMREPYRVLPGDRVALPGEAGAGDVYRPDVHRPRFEMPLYGRVTAHFGYQRSGAWLDGVEISGRAGDTVTAAAAGEVVYVGADLPGYGTLVLVRHEGEYVTAYGYTRRALVRQGQWVRAGQPIAELGMRPDGSARLLFQVRHNSRAVDPAPFLGIGD